MTEKNLISRLNNLRNVKPDAEWLKSNRELLLTQISNSGASDLSTWQTFIINLQSFTKTVYQPVFILGTFIIVLVSGSLFSHQLFTQAKPNDSLYIARIVSEKAKLGTIFNNNDRDRLAVQFAANHAQDITTVLSNPEFNNESNQDQVAHLNESFNKEINTVKTKINRLTINKTPTIPNNEDALVSVASDLTVDQGIQLIEPELTITTATNTIPSIEEIISEEMIIPETVTETDKILDEAQQLFDQKDYNSALNKLKEVDEIIK